MIGAKLPGRPAAALACVALFATWATTGGAQGDDRAAAEAIVVPMDTKGPVAVTAEAVERAKEAFEQATRLRAAGDEAHAKAADGLAREWAETARDLTLAAAAEKLAEDRKRQAMQAQAQLERTRALVEEGIARIGRLRAELDAASAGGPAKGKVAVEVHDGQAPAGAKPQAAAATGSTP
jgi:hypothetical protein